MEGGDADLIDWQYDLPEKDAEGIVHARQELILELSEQPSDMEVELRTILTPPITNEVVWRAIAALTLLQEGFIAQNIVDSTIRLSERGKVFANGIKALKNR